MSGKLSVPTVTVDQMREVDRLMVEEYGIGLLQMMENVGRNLARLAADLAGGTLGERFLVLAGRGNNGGGGLAAARHLSNMGGEVRVLMATAMGDLSDAPARQASTLIRMGLTLREASTASEPLLTRVFREAHLIIDALVGYSLTGAPRGQFVSLIQSANASGKPVLSLDVPSGVDAGSGRVYEPSIRATATLTLALPKTGLASPVVRERLGELYLADIGVPPALYRHLGLKVGALFVRDSVVHLRWSDGGWASDR